MNLTYRQRTALTGALIGAVAGAVFALVYVDRVVDEPGAASSAPLKFSDVTRILITVGGLVRQLNELVAREEV